MTRDATEAEILAYLNEEHPDLAGLAAWTRSAVLAADPDFGERIYRGWQGIGFRHPEAGFVCAIYPRRDWIVLLFEHGASLPDPDGALLGEGKQTRYFRIDRASREVADRITAYVQQAIAERLLR
jgi:hypothetical protein